VRRGVPADKIRVIINGVDLKRYSPQSPCLELRRQLQLEGCFVVGYLGTLGMAHALHCVLDAAQLLRSSHPPVRFLFVGTGAVRDLLVRDATARGLDNVLFVGAQPKERMPLYWGLSDLALVHLRDAPLFTTVIPSKIFEAMGMGVAILIASPDGEATRIVRDTGAGVVLPPENPRRLAQTVGSLSEDANLIGVLRRHAKDAAPRFSRETQAREMIGTLEELRDELRAKSGTANSRSSGKTERVVAETHSERSE